MSPSFRIAEAAGIGSGTKPLRSRRLGRRPVPLPAGRESEKGFPGVTGLRVRVNRDIRRTCFPLADRDDDLNRLPGHRVRRFCLRRSGMQGRVHFLDGTPTAIVLDLLRDERKVLDWIGLTRLADGGELWFDLAARPADAAPPVHPLTGQPVPYDAPV